MRIVLLKDYRGRRAGALVDWPDGTANVLIKRRIAQAVDQPAASMPAKPQTNDLAATQAGQEFVQQTQPRTRPRKTR